MAARRSLVLAMAAAAVLPAPTQFKAARAAVAVMEAYRDGRVQFVMEVASGAPQNAEYLLSLGALQLLLPPLAQDSMASVQSAATLSQGRLANVSHTSANRHHKCAAAYLVKAVPRHAGAELAEAGVLPLLTECLPDAMLTVRETAACALGHVAKHSVPCFHLSLSPYLMFSCSLAIHLHILISPYFISLYLIAGRGCGADSPLSADVTPHSLLRLHATALADAGGIAAVISLLGSPDVKTRRQVLSLCLSDHLCCPLQHHACSSLLLTLQLPFPSLFPCRLLLSPVSPPICTPVSLFYSPCLPAHLHP
ncbi:unnamed protein product [Closterium sp. Naga37s-1]|nr:unnamed protein product [Closterium sp. Naga37s-1]